VLMASKNTTGKAKAQELRFVATFFCVSGCLAMFCVFCMPNIVLIGVRIKKRGRPRNAMTVHLWMTLSQFKKTVSGISGICLGETDLEGRWPKLLSSIVGTFRNLTQILEKNKRRGEWAWYIGIQKSNRCPILQITSGEFDAEPWRGSCRRISKVHP
jgi:hypothetical protein